MAIVNNTKPIDALVTETLYDYRKLMGYFFLNGGTEVQWTKLISSPMVQKEHQNWGLFVKADAGDRAAQKELDDQGISPGAISDMFVTRSGCADTGGIADLLSQLDLGRR